jgi:hypothetical protein
MRDHRFKIRPEIEPVKPSGHDSIVSIISMTLELDEK